MKPLQWLRLCLHDLIYRNRIRVKDGNMLEVGFAERLRMKKVDIHLRGKGNRLVIGRGTMVACCKIRVDGANQTLRIGEDCIYHAGKIYLRYNSDQHIYIGNKTTVEDAYLLTDEDASIEIGEDCMFSKLVHIRAGDGHSVLDAESGKRINHSRDIVLGDRVWLGRGACILKGAEIASDSIVGAYAVVTRQYRESGCAIAGNPAVIVKKGVKWDRRML